MFKRKCGNHLKSGDICQNNGDDCLKKDVEIV